MSYADQQQSGNKTASIAIVVLIHVAIGYLLVTGLAIDAVKQVVERVTTVEVEEEEPPPPDEPPPPPEDTPEPTSPPPPNAPPALIDIPRESPIETTPRETPKEVFREPNITREEVKVDPPKERPPSKARGVKTKGERGWVARIIENYPARAVREELEGTVRLRVTVNSEGRATGCTVTGSSGHDVLDQAACKDVERYSRFDPAWDDAGNPISASWSTSITYKLN